MTEHPVLGQVALGYSPMIDRHRAVIAVRLTVFPARRAVAPNTADLLAAVAEVWPSDGGRVSLNIVSEMLLQDLMGASPPTNVMVEVPAFMASDPVHTSVLRALHKHGNTLLIKGRPLKPLPREVLPCFAYSIVDLADERRDGKPPPGGVARTIPHIQSGVTTLAEMEAAFNRSAIAVLGWPMDGAVAKVQPSDHHPELQFIVELINRVDREEPAERLESVLKSEPTVERRLLRYMNSPAFGLGLKITSFRHAVTLLGYKQLKRWLALLLASASNDPNMKPVMYAAVRRGLLMEELVRGAGSGDLCSEMFICGVLSLLDHMMGQSFEKLLDTVPVTERVRAALVDGSGPYHPYIELVRAVEASSVFDIRAAADTILIGVPEVNRAVLRALAAARQIE
jgi:EAL and modified HD-GYP domain-containing signal transduction protein